MTHSPEWIAVQRGIFAAFGTVKLDYRSPKRLDEAAGIVADFVCAELERVHKMTDRDRMRLAIGDAMCAGARRFAANGNETFTGLEVAEVLMKTGEEMKRRADGEATDGESNG
jgi:hypothetical protein